MKNENKQSENTDQLIEQFFDPAQAEQVKDDLKKGDQLFCQAENAAVPDELIKNIKANIRTKLNAKRGSYKSVMLMKVASVAAAVIIVFVLLNYDDSKVDVTIQSQLSSETTSIWDKFESNDDTDLALLCEEIEQLASAIWLEKMGDGENGYATVSGETDELEKELIEVETIFWKG